MVDLFYLLDNDKWSAPVKIEDVLPCSLPTGKKLQGEIGSSTSEEDLLIFDIDDDVMRRNMQVLQNQITRYAEKIKPDPLFPMLKQVVLIFLSNLKQDLLSLYFLAFTYPCNFLKLQMMFRN